MDWSDDVAYSVHDVEDAVASSKLDLRRLRDGSDAEAVLSVAATHFAPDLGRDAVGAGLERLLATGAVPTDYDGSRVALAGLKDMTSRVIGRFVHAAEAATRAVHGPGDLGRYDARLVVPDESRAEVAVLKAVAAHFVMFSGSGTTSTPTSAVSWPTSSSGSRPTPRRAWTPTCAPTSRPPPTTPPGCVSSSTRW